MKKILLLIIIIIIVYFLNSCGKCRTKETDDCKLSLTDLSIVPYNGNEILTYKNQVEDSVYLTGSYRNSTMLDGYTAPEGETECPSTHYLYEVNKTNFNNNDGSSIWITLEKHCQDFNLFHLSFVIKSPINFNFSENFYFESHNLFCYSENIIVPHDSLTLNNKVFYSVYEFYTNHCNDQTLPKLYYTINMGIIGFQTIDSTIWSINE